jgi:hypothetical protein
MTAATMPFGKFKGATLRNVPDDYLQWLRGLELREPLRTHVAREHARRRARAHRRAPEAPGLRLSPALRETAAELISTGYRTLAKQLHPDSGGSHEQMVALTTVRDVLAAFLRERAA